MVQFDVEPAAAQIVLSHGAQHWGFVRRADEDRRFAAGEAMVARQRGIRGIQKNAAATRTVIRSRAKKSEKSTTASCGATRRPNDATGFRTIDCTHRTTTLVTFAFRH
jgi:nitroreductase